MSTYTLPQLAALFQRHPKRVLELLPELQNSHGFPRRLPALRNVWSKPAVDRWFEMNGEAAKPSPGMVAATAAADVLQQRYGRE